MLRVERAVGLILELIGRCGGLDGDGDGEEGKEGDGMFTLDLHEVGLRSLWVDEGNKIVSSLASSLTNTLIRILKWFCFWG